MTAKTHRIKYDHGDGRCGTRCGIELRKINDAYYAQSRDPLRRVTLQWDRPISIRAEGTTPTCARCLREKWRRSK